MMSLASGDEGNGKGQFSFPACWKDNAIMQLQFAMFRSRDLDTEDYDAKMKFWKDLIGNYLEFAGRPIFSLRDLQLQFMRGVQLPACLDTVIMEMQQRKQIRYRSEFEHDPANSWSAWLVNSLVKRPLSWSWAKIKYSVVAEDLEASSLVEWVHLDVLNNICELITEKVLSENSGKLLHFDAFKSLCKSQEVRIHSDNDFRACLLALNVRQIIGLEFKTEKGLRQIHLIKIPKKQGDDLNISQEDHAVHNLQNTQAQLLKQLENLEEEIKVNDDKARQYMKENKRQMAKTYLRKRHLLEKNHERRSIALHNIESLLSSVDEAQNSGVVMDAYKIGSNTLKKVLSDSGLKYDNVDEVLADVRDTLDQHREVQDTLSNSVVEGVSQEEDQLEKELRELCGETSKVFINPLINNNDKPEVVITDEEMIAMLQELEVEDGTVSQSSTRAVKTLQGL
ncbi:charged multivesicular body protein 7 [Drosophila ficusphila]|uniref:charged multivesicular body protein 7 n=1 Tax=Drosophila ficusphila TaxID=30025 RepID=UPI0007E87867|nr:charged multivesicular body protein 7 [Drosophila ficusphila]